jgi:ABC-2 type transport system ATP-binding protein
VNAVEVHDVHKSFRRVKGLKELLGHSQFDVALGGVDLTVPEGEIFGLLGPNGAGKTTLIKILCGLIIADSGQVSIAGRDITDKDADTRRVIGVVYGDERSFHWRLSVRDNLRFFARLYRMDRTLAEKRITELIDLVGLAHAADRRMLGFSSGMKQRASIARGMLHDPHVILMDEPTRMLDPVGAHDLQALIRERIADEGRTVLLATNLMAEAETMCDRLMLIDHGTAVMTGTVEEFRAAYSPETVYRFVVEGRLSKVDHRLASVPGVMDARVDQLRVDAAEVVVTFDGPRAALPAVIRILVDDDVQIVSCVKEEASLDQVFRTVVGARAREELACAT